MRHFFLFSVFLILVIFVFQGKAFALNDYDMDSQEIYNYLQAKDFENLEALLDSANDPFVKTRHGIDFFSTIVGTYAFRGDAFSPEHIQAIEEWISAYPQSAYPYIFRARHRFKKAHAVRGSSYTSETAPEKMEAFREILTKTYDDLDRAQNIDPYIADIWVLRNRLAKNFLSYDRDAQESLFEESFDYVPDYNYLIYRERLEQLLPKWGGSWKEARAFVRSFYYDENAPNSLKTLSHDLFLEYVLAKREESSYLASDEVWPEIEKTYLAAAADHPQSGKWYKDLGDFARRGGQLDVALQYLDKAKAVDPQLRSTYGIKGRVLRSQKRYNEALKEWAQLLKMEPANLEALRHYGLNLVSLDKRDLAARVYKKAIGYHPENAHTHALACNNYNKMKDVSDEALSICRESISLNVYKENPYYYVYMNHKEAGKLDVFNEMMDDIYLRYPELPYASRYLCYSYYVEEDIYLSKHHCRNTIALDPDTPLPYWYLGTIHTMLGEFEEGSKYMNIYNQKKS